MALSIVYPLTKIVGYDQVAPYINLPIPDAPGAVGAASIQDAFPAATMTAITGGGVPPSGADMNGLLYMMSAYCVYITGGRWLGWDSTIETALGGYDKGAILQQSADTNAFWISQANTNSVDPDTTSVATNSSWMSTKPLWYTTAPTAGAHTDNTLPGPSDYVWDVNTAAGAITLNGFVAGRDGQRLVVCNTGANPLTITSNTGAGANQVRASSNTTLLQNDSVALQYVTAITKWVVT